MAIHRKAASFRRALNVSAMRWKEKAVIVLNGITLRVFEIATIGTRVDTGRARAGWMVSVGQVSKDLPSGNFKPSKKKSGPAVFDSSPPNTSEFLQKLSNAPLGLSRFVFNNVDYIVFLEIGTKYTPGDWMLRKAVSAVQAAGLAS